jgi:hypothetical protein
MPAQEIGRLGTTANRKRAFADVVSIDAWHDRFDSRHSTVDLHADVVFGVARVGGEIDSPIRFRLSVKRAELVVVIPETEPVSVNPKSVAREVAEPQGHLTEIIEQKTQAHSKGKLSAGISPNKVSGSISAEAEANAAMSSSKKLKISSTVRFMTVTTSKTEEGYYRWLIRPSTTAVLEGSPWDASNEPRLKLIDQRKDRSKGIPPTVRVEVRCRREDLVIEGLEAKDEGIWGATKSRLGFRNRMAAAISYIRDRLSEEGLEVNNIEDIFGQVTLGSVTAESV